MRSRGERRARTGALLAAAGAALAAHSPGALPAAFARPIEVEAREHEVKAVFIYNFTRYMRWPPAGSQGDFEIAVLGSSPVLEPLQAIAAKRTAGERRIVVRAVSSLAALDDPEILFLPIVSTRQLADVVELTRGRPILTVAEDEGAAARGVAVAFVTREGTVRLEINRRALQGQGIQASSQLLKLATLVGESE